MSDVSHSKWYEDCVIGIAAYYLTSLPVVLGVLLGADFLHPGSGNLAVPRRDVLAACIHFDAFHYIDIVGNGYSYDPAKRSTVAFFPAYPFLAWCVTQFGLGREEATLLTANAALIVAFVLMASYVRVRWPGSTIWQREFVLAIFGLWPLGLFWRMPYAESLLLAGMLLFLCGMVRGWPLLVLGILAGFPTAVRPVGVAVTGAFVWHLLTRPGMHLSTKLTRLLVLGPLACWGLIAWMGYQWLVFDAPLAYIKTQEHWTFMAPPDRGWSAKFWSLATMEPIWGAYFDSNRGAWFYEGIPGGRLFSLHFWDPILFVLAAVIVVIGGCKRWLSGGELILGLGLLAIPYVTRSFEMSMASHGRFAAVVVVNYLVLGRLFTGASPITIAGICTGLALALCVLTSLYAADYLVF